MKHTLSFAGLLALTLWLSACNGGGGSSSDDKSVASRSEATEDSIGENDTGYTESEVATDDDSALKYKTIGTGRISFEIPATMTKAREHRDAKAQLEYSEDDLFLICLVYEESKADRLEENKPDDLTSYFIELIHKFQSENYISNFGFETEQQVGGFPAIIGKIAGWDEDCDLEKASYYNHLCVLETSKSFYAIVYGAHRYGRMNLPVVFEHALRTVKIKS